MIILSRRSSGSSLYAIDADRPSSADDSSPHSLNAKHAEGLPRSVPGSHSPNSPSEDPFYPPPGFFLAEGSGAQVCAVLGDDGRIDVKLNLNHGNDTGDLPAEYETRVAEFAVDETHWRDVPYMNVVIMIVGSRDELEPYLAFARALKMQGHRCRIATHGCFRHLVVNNELEFFDIGGDPSDLLAYSVRNRGLVPGAKSMLNGDVQRKRDMIREMLHGCYRACFEQDVSGINDGPGPSRSTSRQSIPFIANAIISSPTAIAHVHVAQALGIPCHMTYTIPWTATAAFPHPLASIAATNAQPRLTNYLSYALTDHLHWQSIGHVVNKFRSRTLYLEKLDMRSGAGVLETVRVPWTYCWSPHVIPNPPDWVQVGNIDVAGFYFSDSAVDYKPPPELAEFLQLTPPPVYIGLSSVVAGDQAALADVVLEAVQLSNVRAIVSASSSKFGGRDVPRNVFVIGDCPLEWLFPRVAGVVHHGDAGSTAIGMKFGRPTIAVPSFGDQPFWGDVIQRCGAGPAPIPFAQLTAERLSMAINYMFSPQAQSSVRDLSARIRHEDGIGAGIDSFYRHLPLKNMRCDLEPSRVAVWWSREHCLKLSAFAAQVLADAKLIDVNELHLHRSIEYDPDKPITDPFSMGAVETLNIVVQLQKGAMKLFYQPHKGVMRMGTAVPIGMFLVLEALEKGFTNLPGHYGSDIRHHGKISGLVSGGMEGGRALYYGFHDGITGLATHPKKGHEKEGWKGAAKGFARSLGDLAFKPTAGVVGFVSHPIRGAVEQYQSWRRSKTTVDIVRMQRTVGFQQAQDPANRAARKAVLDQWPEIWAQAPERASALRKQLQEALFQRNAHQDAPVEDSPSMSQPPPPPFREH